MVIVDRAAYIAGERVEFEGEGSGAAPPRTAADGFVWLGLRIPDEHELTDACDALGLDEVSVADVLKPHARPVLTVEGSTLHLVLRTAEYEDLTESIALGEMTILIGPRTIVSIRHGNASPLSEVRSRLESNPNRLRLGPTAVLAAVVERVIADYGPALDGFENDVVEVEREVFSESAWQPVQRLYRLKRELRRFLVATDSLQDPLARMIRMLGSEPPEEVMADLHEARDQLDRAVTRANSLSELLDAALTASLTQITVRQNDDMRRISAWVAMAAVPTMVAGIYGMNFDSMPELRWHFGYPLVMVATGAVVAFLYRRFKRGGWL